MKHFSTWEKINFSCRVYSEKLKTFTSRLGRGKVKSQIESKRVSLFLLVFFFFQSSAALFLSAYTITSSCKTISQSFSAQLRLQTKYLLLTYKGSNKNVREKKQQQKTKSMAYACRIGLQFNCNFDPIMFVRSFCWTFFS